MGLIKSQNAPATLPAFSMQDVEQAAKNVLLRARQQAEQFLAAAQEEAETLRASAKAQGFAEGHAAGTKKGLEEGDRAGRDKATAERSAELTQLVQALKQVLGELEASRVDLEAQALTEVVQLAVAVARRVTKQQGAVDPTVLTGNLQEAMKLAVHAADLRIAVHPDQKKVLHDVLPTLKLTWPTLEHAQLIDDPTLTPGGCRLFTRHGEIHADLEGQLNRVIADLLPAAAAAESAA